MSENNEVTADMQVKDFGPDAQKENASAVITQVEVEKLLDSNEKGNLYKAVAEMVKSAGEATAARSESNNGITPEAILERIDRIIADKTHIEDAVRILNGVTTNSTGMGTLPHGMSVIVEEREKTNREMISLLRDMYNDAMGKKAESDNDPDVKKLDKLAEVLAKNNLSEENATAIIQTAARQMFTKAATGDVHGDVHHYK